MPPISNGSIPLDFIEFFRKSPSAIYDIVAPLYKNGLSITDIATQTGLKRNSIWRCLKSHQKELRPQTSISFKRWRKGTGKMGARPPYGYSFFQGEVIKDPKEYPVIQLIQNLWKQGMSINSIISRLHERGSQSRMKKPWSYNVIKSIVKRSGDGSDQKMETRIKSKNKKLNSTEVEREL